MPVVILVSIRAPAREATGASCVFVSSGLFRSAPPRGKRPSSSLLTAPRSCFDPRPRAGSDNGRPSKRVMRRVSIRAPAREATFHQCNAQGHRSRFDPRPRAGSDTDGTDEACRVLVSIRAPAREATPESKRGRQDETVSIRAPAREATMPNASSCRRNWFRSAPPRGKRLGDPAQLPPIGEVSIRAPAREATCCTSSSATSPWEFRSAPPRGRRPLSDPNLRHRCGVSIRAPAREATGVGTSSGYVEWFRSAPPRGRRPPCRTLQAVDAIGFDPRPRAGGDLACSPA